MDFKQATTARFFSFVFVLVSRVLVDALWSGDEVSGGLFGW